MVKRLEQRIQEIFHILSYETELQQNDDLDDLEDDFKHAQELAVQKIRSSQVLSYLVQKYNKKKAKGIGGVSRGISGYNF